MAEYDMLDKLAELIEIAKIAEQTVPAYDEIGRNMAFAHFLNNNGVTVQECLIAKQVVIDKKYGSVRCPSCNAVLGASSHYCWQCGQKVTHKLPQPPKGE